MLILGSLFVFTASLLLTLITQETALKLLALMLAMICGIGIGSIRSVAETQWRDAELEPPARSGRYIVNLNGSVVSIAVFHNGAWQGDKAAHITDWKPLSSKPRPRC